MNTRAIKTQVKIITILALLAMLSSCMFFLNPAGM